MSAHALVTGTLYRDPVMRTSKTGKASPRDGRLLGYACRWNIPPKRDGEKPDKEFSFAAWCRNRNGECRRRLKHLPAPRPRAARQGRRVERASTGSRARYNCKGRSGIPLAN
jgi:hypothetical protein